MLGNRKCDSIVEHMKKFMSEAIKEAKKARDLGEVPVGAIVEKDGTIIGRGHNLTESTKDPTAHAELLALRSAAEVFGDRRLTGCNLYVTTEPCAMCAGAIVLARIQKLYIGTMDPKSGCCGSIFNIPQEKKLNHYVNIHTGLMEQECADIMKDFFRQLRRQKAEEKEC